MKSSQYSRSVATLAVGIFVAALTSEAAADVTFSIRRDSLIVKGDQQDDQVAVEVSGGDVLVNGENTGLAGNSLDNLTIKTGGGDDQVQVGGIGGFFVSGNLKISTGSGNDDVTIVSGDVNQKTKVNTGGDNDSVTVEDVVFFGPVKIVTGGGIDVVDAASTAGFVTFFEPVKFTLGSGDDTLNRGNGTVFIEDQALFNGGSGTDLLVISGVPTDPDLLPPVDGIKIKGFEAP